MVRNGFDIGGVGLVVKSNIGDLGLDPGSELPRNASILKGREGVTIVRPANDLQLKDKDGKFAEGWFASAYRPWRGGRRFVDDSDSSSSYASPAPREGRFASLFDDYSNITPIREWLADLDYRQLKETGSEAARAKAVFDSAIHAIEAIFPEREIKFSEVTPTKDVVFIEHGLRVGLGSLSDGYRSAISWIGDLVRRLVDAFPDMENPLHAYGVVLVDEIDLHLHPKWQRSIIGQVRQVFPNLQFIVTTHSPFIAQEMTETDKIIVLQRNGDRVTATEDKGFVQGWRVDQILTSYLFGLSGTRGKPIEDAELLRQELLDANAGNGLTAHERQELTRVNELISRVKSPPNGHTDVSTASEAELRRAANDLLGILAGRHSATAKKR